MASTVVVLTRPGTTMTREGLSQINDMITLNFKDYGKRDFFANPVANDFNVLLGILDNEKIKKYLVFVADLGDGKADIKIFDEDHIESLMDVFIETAGKEAEGDDKIPAWEIIRQLSQEIAKDEGNTDLVAKYEAIAYDPNEKLADA